VIGKPQHLHTEQRFAKDHQDSRVFRWLRSSLNRDEFGSQEGFHVGFGCTPPPMSHRRTYFCTQLRHGFSAGRSTRVTQFCHRHAEIAQLFRRGVLEEAIKPLGNVEALRRVIGDFLHLGEYVADCVAHAFDSSTSAASHLTHFVQRQALGAACQRAGEFEDFLRFVQAHAGHVRI
jgi:hypothetical protein